MKKNKIFILISHNNCHTMKEGKYESKNNLEVTGE